MIPHPVQLSHTFLDLEGAWGVVAEVALFFVLFLHVAALVVVSERPWPRRRKLAWSSLALLVPLIGPVITLAVTIRAARRRDHASSSRSA